MACCRGCRSGAAASFFCAPYHAGNPSSVVTDLPCTAETGVTHERVSTPFTSTEQEPHWASPQPNRGPCSSSSFARTYNRGVSRAEATIHDRSFTLILSSPAILCSVTGRSLRDTRLPAALWRCEETRLVAAFPLALFIADAAPPTPPACAANPTPAAGTVP